MESVFIKIKTDSDQTFSIDNVSMREIIHYGDCGRPIYGPELIDNKDFDTEENKCQETWGLV